MREFDRPAAQAGTVGATLRAGFDDVPESVRARVAELGGVIGSPHSERIQYKKKCARHCRKSLTVIRRNGLPDIGFADGIGKSPNSQVRPHSTSRLGRSHIGHRRADPVGPGRRSTASGSEAWQTRCDVGQQSGQGIVVLMRGRRKYVSFMEMLSKAAVRPSAGLSAAAQVITGV